MTISTVAILTPAPPFSFITILPGSTVCFMMAVGAMVDMTPTVNPLVQFQTTNARMVSFTEAINPKAQFTMTVNPLVAFNQQIGCNDG